VFYTCIVTEKAQLIKADKGTEKKIDEIIKSNNQK